MRLSLNTVGKNIVILLVLYTFLGDLLSHLLPRGIIGYLDELLVVILILLWCLRKKVRFAKGYLELIVLWIFIGLIGDFFRNVSLFVAMTGAFLQIKNYMLFLTVVSLKWNRQDFEKIKSKLVYLYIIIVAVALLSCIIPSLRITDRTYVTSIFLHEGTFATLIVPMCLYALVNYLESNKNRIMLIVLALGFLCFLMAGTIKNLISFAIISCWYLLISKKSRKYIFLIVGVVAVGIALPYLVAMFSDELQANIFATTASNRPRWILYRNGLQLARDYFPVGSGFGTYGNSVSISIKNYSQVYIDYGMNSRYGFEKGNVMFLSDTYWPSVIGETGFIGCAIAIILLTKMYKLIKKSVVMCNNISYRNDGYIVWAIFEALIIESFFTATFFGQRSYLGIILLGIYISSIYNNSYYHNPRNSNRRYH